MRLAVYGIIAVGVAGLAVYDQYDKKANYQPVDARISAVSDQCYMEKVDRGAFKKTTSTSDLVRCEVAGLFYQAQDRNPVRLFFSGGWSDSRLEPDNGCLPQRSVARG